LSSARQRMMVDARGEVSAEGLRRAARGGRPTAALRAAIVLKDLEVELPRLDLEAPPPLLPDPRIRVGDAGAPGKAREQAGTLGAFAYEVAVRTPPGTPLRLHTNLAKAPVPVRLDVKMKAGQGLSGEVELLDFPVEIFRRQARVERLRVRLAPGPEGMRGERLLDGSVRVEYADFTIRVLLLGTADRPIIRLTSDPPLPDHQILAALLFGKAPDELDPEESESVGSASAAVADRAVGLASLYVLASTPVQSIGYDPRSGVFSAKVKLGEGTSLNVGADPSELKEVGVRRRLTRFWSIVTAVLNPTDPAGRDLTALLEWRNRY
jgi:hypothetical protein